MSLSLPPKNVYSSSSPGTRILHFVVPAAVLLLCACERCACVGFAFFKYPGGAKGLLFFQKTPRPYSKIPGAPIYACKIIAPRGAFTRNVTVARPCYRKIRLFLSLTS